MKKPFLLIMGDYYYPSSGTEDWKKCYSSYQEAKDNVIFVSLNRGFQHFDWYIFAEDNVDRYYHWYSIVDLREWTET